MKMISCLWDFRPSAAYRRVQTNRCGGESWRGNPISGLRGDDDIFEHHYRRDHSADGAEQRSLRQLRTFWGAVQRVWRTWKIMKNWALQERKLEKSAFSSAGEFYASRLYDKCISGVSGGSTEAGRLPPWVPYGRSLNVSCEKSVERKKELIFAFTTDWELVLASSQESLMSKLWMTSFWVFGGN